jgi:hypothetical protein
MAITKEGRELMSNIIKLGDTGPETPTRQGMKTTNVPGYPIILCWARWGGCEPNSSGNNKAFLLLPYISIGQMSLVKYNGATAIENPLDMVMSEAINPYNCKVGITPSLNISKLIEGEYYCFVLAIKPAAVGNGSNPTPYWDGWIKAFGVTANDVFKDYFGLFNYTKSQWSKLKSNNEDQEEDENSPNNNVQQ